MTNVEKLEILITTKNKNEYERFYEEIKEIILREDNIIQVKEKSKYYTTYYCPVCGDYVEPASKYCPECASKMGWDILNE